MTSRNQWVLPLMALVAVLAWIQSPVQAQFNRNGSVGGVVIDANGALRTMTVRDRAKLAHELQQGLPAAPNAIGQAVPVRRISLKGLEQACHEFLQAHPGQPLPDEIQFLGGLQRIQYIIADPQGNDIILAGPAEGWRVDGKGNVVGITTGHPVLQLEDLLVALRNVDQGIKDRITCSIDPTETGFRQMKQLLETQKRQRTRLDPARLQVAVKQAFGPQMVKITGVPQESRFAQIMLAADYRMKRLAMGLDRSPIADLPSYLGLLQRNASVKENSHPRWWLAANFGPIARSDDGLAFALEKSGVKLMTEDEYMAADGTLKQTGRKSKAAQTFASAITRRYDELAKADPLFGELKNLMELSVVAAIIERHALLRKSGASLPILLGADQSLPTTVRNVPKTVPAECSIIRVRQGLLVTASGGVEIDAWELAKVATVNPSVAAARDDYLMPANRGQWWAN